MTKNQFKQEYYEKMMNLKEVCYEPARPVEGVPLDNALIKECHQDWDKSREELFTTMNTDHLYESRNDLEKEITDDVSVYWDIKENRGTPMRWNIQ